MSPKELLTLIVVIPLFLFLSCLFPLTRVLFVVLWVVYLGFDVASTYVFYLEDPSQFSNNERNKLFVWLTNKVGFKKTALLFPLIIEIPLLLIFAVLPLQILYVNMFPLTSNNLWACFATSCGISAIGHLQAALKNTRYNQNQTQQLALNKQLTNTPDKRATYQTFCRAKKVQHKCDPICPIHAPMEHVLPKSGRTNNIPT